MAYDEELLALQAALRARAGRSGEVPPSLEVLETLRAHWVSTIGFLDSHWPSIDHRVVQLNDFFDMSGATRADLDEHVMIVALHVIYDLVVADVIHDSSSAGLVSRLRRRWRRRPLLA